ncbi:beta-propeller domain-containing protein [Yinghuangia seranimata]|uniref:beta-propeller domain-containing protein n=1 Tax=Yinghuangia seranimata TaxID=408067 RepID=UPI00248BE118|nr:beta-propeller domain-containing protein [Yinghuangia seranimata]MDI2125344.1 beta-propeller domain-containing protein [Yinghuangia seranimata]
MRIDDGNLGPAGPHAPGARSSLSLGPLRGRAVAGVLLAAGLVATGCTSSSSGKPPVIDHDPARVVAPADGVTGTAAAVRAKMLTLSRFDSCDALLKDYQAAALAAAPRPWMYTLEDGAPAIAPAPGPAADGSGMRSATGAAAPPGLTGGSGPGQAGSESKSGAVAAPAAPAAPNGGTAPTSAPDHSNTNTHEQGVDEPDIVKTDGRRVVTVADEKLRVIDAATHQQTGALTLPNVGTTDMLISGDRALVIIGSGIYDGGKTLPPVPMPMPAGTGAAAPKGGSTGGSSGSGSTSTDTDSLPVNSSKLILVDLSGTPKVLGELTVEGGFLDARQVGGTARVVVRSTPGGPTIDWSGSTKDNEGKYRKALQNTTVDDWLPGYTLKNGDHRSSGRLLDCGAVSRPDTDPGASGHTGTSTLSVLTFDLSRDLDTGHPVGLAADADTVYGTPNSLYVAADYYPVTPPKPDAAKGGPSDRAMAPTVQSRTAVYKFDTTGTGAPRFAASGDVPGTLLNQYSLSEFNGNLRVATTSTTYPQNFADPARPNGSTGSVGGGKDAAAPNSSVASGAPHTESAVTVLGQKNADLVPLGRAGGLGQGERIYAVRFVGPVGYVVTFRQTDPLYTLDLSNPAAPKVLGQLKINGYSAYLHPIDNGQLIGVGQDATDSGRRTGTQVSLFDVHNLADPRRIANYSVQMGSSEAEMDPHAFLYWPATGTLVIPLTSPYGTATPPGAQTFAPTFGAQALVLRLQGGSFTEAGRISHPNGGVIRRSVVVGDELWTVSRSGVMVNALGDLSQKAWVSFG